MKGGENMSRDEVLALGVPENKYKEFQYLYNRDIEKAAKRLRKLEDSDVQIKSAIFSMLKLIKKPETLEGILKYINNAYYREI